MNFGDDIVSWAMTHSRKFMIAVSLITVILAFTAALPSINGDLAGVLNPLMVDTDPVNMLDDDEPVRKYHFDMKKKYGLYDIIVVGIENDTDPDGVFNVQTLQNIYSLTEYAKTLSWQNEKGEKEGVISMDIMAPSTVDNIEQGGVGEVKFSWLMPEPPKTKEQALAVREKALNISFLKGTLISDDAKSLAIYLPITSKDISYKISKLLEKESSAHKGDDKYYITGLPVANDTFGVQMFVQMAIAAPAAMILIFLLLLFFFKKLTLIISPMIIALISVIVTMSLLVITGNTIHIMSSMIPIFIMPIAVLDSIHLLSEFFDRYPKTKNRAKTIKEVVRTLFNPMLFTSLTSMAGFASLALTPIPPVQVFGIFVAIGIFVAWILTITFIPAYIMLMPESTLDNFGSSEAVHGGVFLSGLFKKMAKITYRYSALIVVVFIALLVVSIVGMTKIEVNDNPVKWFTKSHSIRVADDALNSHFSGTYMTYLTLDSLQEKQWRIEKSDFIKEISSNFDSEYTSLVKKIEEKTYEYGENISYSDALVRTIAFIETKMDEASDDDYELLDEILVFVENKLQALAVFKQPDTLRYISGLQEHLVAKGVIGKSNSIADLVKTVYRELLGGDQDNYKIPETDNAVAQSLISYQGSHRPQDLWHFVASDYKSANLWIQLKSGDNKSMSNVIAEVDAYFKNNKAPHGIEHNWFGLPYINVIWQQKMVSGMFIAFMGSFLVVFVMMMILFRSALWGAIAMIPLTITVAVIYGIVGWIGKSYDMPVAVLSSLTLGLAVDFAIHFLARARSYSGRWSRNVFKMFDEPANAITKNIIVIAIGFLPLLFAPLVPYQTVGVFLASILVLSGVSTLLLLPALLRLLEKPLSEANDRNVFSCADVFVLAISMFALVLVNLQMFVSLSSAVVGACLLLTMGFSYITCQKIKKAKN